MVHSMAGLFEPVPDLQKAVDHLKSRRWQATTSSNTSYMNRVRKRKEPMEIGYVLVVTLLLLFVCLNELRIWLARRRP